MRRIPESIVVLSAVLIGVLLLVQVDAVFYSPSLVFILGVVFLTTASLIVAYLIGSHYLSTGSKQLLLLGTGVLLFGLARMAGGLLYELADRDAAFSAQESGILLSALVHIVAMVAALNPGQQTPIRGRGLYLFAFFGSAAAALAVISALAKWDILPPFFEADLGATSLSQAVVGGAFIAFAGSSIIAIFVWYRSRLAFSRWYAMALLLITLGLAGLLIGHELGSFADWSGRAMQYLSGVYLIVAAGYAMVEVRTSRTSLPDTLAPFLRQSEANYRLVVESATSAIVSVDSDKRVLIWNRAAENIFGYRQNEVVGSFLDSLIVPEGGYNFVARELSGLEADDSTVRMGTVIEVDACRKDGSVFPAEFTFSARKTPSGWINVILMNDISERRHYEQQLQFQTRILAQVSDAVIAIDNDRRVMYWNHGAEKLYGVPENQALGAVLEDIQPYPWWGPGKEEEVLAILDREGYWRGETTHLGNDGTPLCIDAGVTTLRDDGGTRSGLLAVVRDITHHKQNQRKIEELARSLERRAEELGIANRELESFAYSVSHDLRAPLRSLQGFSQALVEDYRDILDEEGRDYLRRIRQSSELMGRLIDDLLKLSRVSRSEMHRRPVDLSSMAGSIMEDRLAAVPDRKVEFTIEPGMAVEGDPDLLRLMMENLLDNALKFTSKVDTARVEIGSVFMNGFKTYYVRDNGAGFDMRFIDKLFAPFQRLHKSSEFPGTGIGLATVQRIARRHNGRVWAKASPGAGATFYFTLN